MGDARKIYWTLQEMMRDDRIRGVVTSSDRLGRIWSADLSRPLDKEGISGLVSDYDFEELNLHYISENHPSLVTVEMDRRPYVLKFHPPEEEKHQGFWRTAWGEVKDFYRECALNPHEFSALTLMLGVPLIFLDSLRNYNKNKN